jgi:hypothetical protein
MLLKNLVIWMGPRVILANLLGKSNKYRVIVSFGK